MILDGLKKQYLKKKIPSEMEVAPCYNLLTLLTLLTLFEGDDGDEGLGDLRRLSRIRGMRGGIMRKSPAIDRMNRPQPPRELGLLVS